MYISNVKYVCINLLQVFHGVTKLLNLLSSGKVVESAMICWKECQRLRVDNQGLEHDVVDLARHILKLLASIEFIGSENRLQDFGCCTWYMFVDAST